MQTSSDVEFKSYLTKTEYNFKVFDKNRQFTFDSLLETDKFNLEQDRFELERDKTAFWAEVQKMNLEMERVKALAAMAQSGAGTYAQLANGAMGALNSVVSASVTSEE